MENEKKGAMQEIYNAAMINYFQSKINLEQKLEVHFFKNETEESLTERFAELEQVRKENDLEPFTEKEYEAWKAL